MTTKINCWEFLRCERQPDGSKAAELGVCPVTTAGAVDGQNGGRNGGRVCYGITGSLCGGSIQGSYAEKLGECLDCEFYQKVKAEEGASFVLGFTVPHLMK